MYGPKHQPRFPFRIILDSIADGVFTVDLDFRITSSNRAAEEITGSSGERSCGWASAYRRDPGVSNLACPGGERRRP
jgi:PAS domain-containing protein